MLSLSDPRRKRRVRGHSAKEEIRLQALTVAAFAPKMRKRCGRAFPPPVRGRRIGSSKLSRRQFLKAGAVLLGAGASLGAYTWRWEPHWVEVVERRLAIALLPREWMGARLVHLSDLHIGPPVDDSYLIRTFETVKSLAPDMVVYTGDLIGYEGDSLAPVRRLFSHLPLGSRATFGVLGNHDYGTAWAHPKVAEGISALAGAAGLRILRNESIEVSGLQVAGMDDLWANRFEPVKALGDLDPKGASFVLSHNPDTADLPGWERYAGWILSGHTHGGQCKPPFLPPPLLPVRNRRYTAGEFMLAGGRRMYINRGIGHLLQVRFNVRPEVTLFHLDRA